MLNKQIIKRTIKTAISDIIAVFLILLIMYLGIILLGRDYINSLELLLNTYSIVRTSKNETNNIDLKLDVQKNKLIEYPEYGTK